MKRIWRETVIDKEGNMTWESLQRAALVGTIHDDMNPVFIFSSVSTRILERIATGEIDLKALLECELKSRSRG